MIMSQTCNKCNNQINNMWITRTFAFALAKCLYLISMDCRLTSDQPALSPPFRSTAATPLTRDDSPRGAAVHYVTLGDMKLALRPWRVLILIRDFTQLRTSQVNALLFSDVTTPHPCYRTLNRLKELNLIELVQEPLRGGARGGSGESVWQLSRQGWKHFPGERRSYNRTISYHALAVADAFVAARQAEREGWLDIKEWHVEDDAWDDVAGVDIRPDLFLIVDLYKRDKPFPLWLEVDLGGERQKQIIEKLQRYAYAYEHREKWWFYQQHEMFPEVLWLPTDAERAKELERIIKRTTDVPDGLMSVELIESFPQSLR